MSFFEDASLVLIPSAQKTSKVYSVKPTDGTGDLAFTRSNDTATRVGPDGLIEKVRTNLAKNSEAFNLWLASDSTTTANAAANPLNGATTADKVIASATTAEHNVYYSVTSVVGEITTSVYAKADGYNFLYLRNTSSSGGGVWFNLSTGAIATQQSGRVGTITSVGNGWYRCSVTWNQPTAGTNQFIIVGPAPSDNTATYLGDGTSGVLLFGAQMEYGVMTDYIATTTAAVSVGPVANVPRLDYLNSSCPRLLLEPQRTNLANWSEQADQYTKVGATIGSNVVTSPDGYTNADSIIEDGSTGGHAFYNFGLTTFTAAAYTASVFAKKGGRDWFALSLYDGTQSFNAFFNLNTGVVGFVGAGATATITNYGNGWYRCTVTATTAAGGSGGLAIYSASADNVVNYAGTNGLAAGYFYGWQLEASASYATSYIPTLGAAVTRGADAASKTGISSLIGQTEGTLFVEITTTDDITTVTPIGISDGTGSNRVLLYVGSGILNALVTVSGTAQATISSSAISANTRYKMAIAYKANDFAFYVNGVQIGTDTSGTVPSCSKFAYDNGSGSAPFYGLNNQAILFKTRLSNSELAALTA